MFVCLGASVQLRDARIFLHRFPVSFFVSKTNKQTNKTGVHIIFLALFVDGVMKINMQHASDIEYMYVHVCMCIVCFKGMGIVVNSVPKPLCSVEFVVVLVCCVD